MTDQLENDSEDLPDQIAVRMAKREKLNELGDAYPVSLPITHTIAQVRSEFPNLEIDVATGKTVSVAGRVVFARNTGKLCFATLQSGDGERIQAMVSLDKVGEESLELYKELVDLGDHLFVEGEVITSKRGELSIREQIQTARSQLRLSVFLTLMRRWRLSRSRSLLIHTLEFLRSSACTLVQFRLVRPFSTQLVIGRSASDV